MNRPKQQRPQTNSLFQGSDETLFSTLFWNAGGLTQDKFSEFKTLVFNNDIDIYGIVEAGASTDCVEFFQLKGYQTYVLPRARQIASGIVVAAKSSILVKFKIIKKHTTTDKLEGIELCAWRDGFHRRFLVLYNPPRNKPDLTWLETIWGRGCILYGDLNAPSTLWGYPSSDSTGRIFEEFVASNPVQHIENDSGSPTFLSYAGKTSHPDVVLAHPSNASETALSLLPPPGGFGHKILLVVISRNQHKAQEDRRARWNRGKANWKKYAELTDKYLTDSVMTKNTEQSLKNVNGVIWKCALKSVPRGYKKKYAPFWNDSLEKLKSERDRARRELENNNTLNNRISLKKKAAIFKKEIISAKRTAYRNFLSNLDFRKDGLKAHNFVSQLNNQRTDNNNAFKKGQRMLTSEKDIAMFFCKHYAKVSNYRPDKRNGKPNVQLPPTCENEKDFRLLSEQIQPSELELALTLMKKGKSAGPDEILPEFLIHLGPKAKGILLLLFRQVWSSYIPSLWRKAEIIPVLKKSKVGDAPENFRPIALTSVLSKLFERIIARRLEIFLELNKGLSDKQAGFRRRRNTVEHVAWLSQAIKDGFHRKQNTLAVLVDFKTAFDRVWRNKLLSKLIEKGVTGRLFNCVSSFLSQRFIRVRYRSKASVFKQTKQGLPQGSVLSPLLFNVMIDDVIATVESIPGVSSLLYADDLVIWATSSNAKALESCLNEALFKLKAWADSNEMLVNPQKTEYQLFTLSTKSHEVSLQYGNENLTRSEETTYLGIKLDSKLGWSKQIEKQVNQASKRMGLLKRLTGARWGAAQDILSLAYKAYVRPIMEYGSEVTITASDSSLRKLDLIQNHALRLITGGPKSTPIAAMEMQACVEPINVRREWLALNMYERVQRLGISYWKSYKPATGRLKTQSTFVSTAENIARRWGIDNIKRQEFPPLADQEALTVARCSLELILPVSKDNILPAELKAVALDTIAQWYPPEEWLHVFTDGSAIDARKNAGAGVFCSQFKLSAPVGQQASNFEGEVKAVELALERVQMRVDRKVVLFVDSQAAIKSIASHALNDSLTVLRCRSQIHSLLLRGTTVVLQWIPSHCGLHGNEEADKLAKEGSQMDQPDLPLPFSDAKRLIKNKLSNEMKKKQHAKAAGKQWEALIEPSGLIPPRISREQFVACFRLLTGHDYLQRHLWRIGVVHQPSCILCDTGEDMSASHLDTCPALEDIRSKFSIEDSCYRKAAVYWAARRRMADVASVAA